MEESPEDLEARGQIWTELGFTEQVCEGCRHRGGSKIKAHNLVYQYLLPSYCFSLQNACRIMLLVIIVFDLGFINFTLQIRLIKYKDLPNAM